MTKCSFVINIFVLFSPRTDFDTEVIKVLVRGERVQRSTTGPHLVCGSMDGDLKGISVTCPAYKMGPVVGWFPHHGRQVAVKGDLSSMIEETNT